MLKKLFVRGGIAVGGLLAAGAAMAVPVVDYASAVTTATAEIGSSVATALPLFGTVMAIGVGIRIMHKFSRG